MGNRDSGKAQETDQSSRPQFPGKKVHESLPLRVLADLSSKRGGIWKAKVVLHVDGKF